MTGADEWRDFRDRLRDTEEKANSALQQMAVHEEKCAGRYKMILGLLLISMAMNLPTAWPHLATFLGLVR
jgi:hypothetical protein